MEDTELHDDDAVVIQSEKEHKENCVSLHP